ncbi:hypothetical protein [Cysteiniphilum litorale]|uniref:hypothetical protein n=1 Tax=Cysteiniphilum litorale TaxID=2056700 RepID=UPI003F8834FC
MLIKQRLVKHQIIKTFIIYVILYGLIAALSAWIPFMGFGVLLGGISIAIAAIVVATLRIIDHYHAKDYRIGVRKFAIAIVILVLIDVIYTLIVTINWS